MDTNNDILKELNEISPLIAGLPKTNVYSVPDNYFNTIIDTVMVSICEDYSTINSISPVSLMKEPPENYFINLPAAILNKIKIADSVSVADEINTLSELVAVSNKNLFQVPIGYFDTLPATIIGKIKSANGTKIVSISSRQKLWKYAVAAALMTAVAVGTYRYFDHPIKNIQTSSANITLDPSIEAGKQMNESDFNEMLNNLSAGAISTYLENNNDEGDIAILTSGLEEGSLPKQDDYLLNENTLQNYINKIDQINN